MNSKSEYRKRLIQKHKENNECVDCGNPLDTSGVRCEKCREKRNAIIKELRGWYQSNGICPRCGKNKLYGSEKNCIECRAYSYESSMKSRENLGKDHYNKLHAEWSKNRYHKRINEGICPRCGKRKPDGGFKTCGICRAKDRNKKRERSVAEDRGERHKRGLCFFCDNPVLENYKVCKEHYDKAIKNLQHPKCIEATRKMKKDNNKFFAKK